MDKQCLFFRLEPIVQHAPEEVAIQFGHVKIIAPAIIPIEIILHELREDLKNLGMEHVQLTSLSLKEYMQETGDPDPLDLDKKEKEV